MGDYTKLAPASQHTLRGNATACAARACPSPLKILKNAQICAKKAVLLQVVFSSFFVITFFGTIGGVDTQQVTRPN